MAVVVLVLADVDWTQELWVGNHCRFVPFDLVGYVRQILYERMDLENETTCLLVYSFLLLGS